MFSNSSVLIRQSDNMKTAFSKRSTLGFVFETFVLGDRKRRVSVDANPTQIKKMHFQNYLDTCGRGLSFDSDQNINDVIDTNCGGDHS